MKYKHLVKSFTYYELEDLCQIKHWQMTSSRELADLYDQEPDLFAYDEYIVSDESGQDNACILYNPRDDKKSEISKLFKYNAIVKKKG
jgi:hypothetical protein